MKQILTKLKEKNSPAIIVENFNITFTIMDRKSRQNINKEMKDLNNTIN